MRLFAAASLLLAGAYAGAPPSSFATPPRPPPRSSGLFNFSSALGDHMVLRMAPARALVWGSDAPGTNVTVAIDGGAGGSFYGQTDATGTWRVVLGAVGAGGPHSLSATSSGGGDALALQDVYFGAVFVCGGQSNSELERPRARGAPASESESKSESESGRARERASERESGRRAQERDYLPTRASERTSEREREKVRSLRAGVGATPDGRLTACAHPSFPRDLCLQCNSRSRR
jgi:hypothetical protein